MDYIHDGEISVFVGERTEWRDPTMVQLHGRRQWCQSTTKKLGSNKNNQKLDIYIYIFKP